MKTTNFVYFFSILLVFTACSQLRIGGQDSSKSQAEDYVEAGMQAFDEGEWKEAALAFDQALKIDGSSAAALSGMALVLAERGQEEAAFHYVEKAIQLHPGSYAAWTTKGRVLLSIGGADSAGAALDAFDKALAIKSDYEPAIFYKAAALTQQKRFDAAIEQLTFLVQKQGIYEHRAEEKLQWLNKIKSAAPKSDLGAEIAVIDEITRADLAVLLAQEIYLVELANRRNPNLYGPPSPLQKAEDDKLAKRAASITDVKGHKAEAMIRDIVRIGGMDIFPDKSFRPNDKIRRMDFALTIQQIIILVTGNRSIDTAFIGAPSPFPDVKQSHYAFNAVSLATERGIMAPNPQTGEFRLNQAISGLDAFLALRRLQAVLNEAG